MQERTERRNYALVDPYAVLHFLWGITDILLKKSLQQDDRFAVEVWMQKESAFEGEKKTIEEENE